MLLIITAVGANRHCEGVIITKVCGRNKSEISACFMLKRFSNLPADHQLNQPAPAYVRFNVNKCPQGQLKAGRTIGSIVKKEL